ncbi:MAG: hypothetical protein HZA68_12940 [Rhodovulum sp.]|nr:hypothetical protein [Rhodovulum sp.]
MTDWRAIEADYAGELARRGAAQAPASLGEIWSAEWARAGLDTIAGVNRPLGDATRALEDAIAGEAGTDLASYATDRGISINQPTVDARIAALGALADTLPEEARARVAPLKDVRKAAADRAQAIEREADQVARATYGLSGIATAFLARAARQTVDPANLLAGVATGPLGGEIMAGRLLTMLGRQAAAGAAAQAVVEPYIQPARADLGLDAGAGRAAANIAEAAIGSAALAGLFRGAGAAVGRLWARGDHVGDATNMVAEPAPSAETGAPRPAPAEPAGEAAPSPAVALAPAPERAATPPQSPPAAPAAGRAPIEAPTSRPTPESVTPTQPREAAPPPTARAAEPPPPRETPPPPARAPEPVPPPVVADLAPEDFAAAAALAERDLVTDPVPAPDTAAPTATARLEETVAAMEAGRPPLPEPEPPAVAVPPKRKVGAAAKPLDELTAVEFLAVRGGLRRDDKLAGELRMIWPDRGPLIPGVGPLFRKTGMTLDRAREALIEGGYLHEPGHVTGAVNRLTPNDVLDILDRSSRGEKVYRLDRGDLATAATLSNAARELQAERMAAEFDARMVQLGFDGEPGRRVQKGLRKRALEIMDRDGVGDPWQAYEQARDEADAKADAARAARQPPPQDVPFGPEPSHVDQLPRDLQPGRVAREGGIQPGQGGAAAPGLSGRPGDGGAGAAGGRDRRGLGQAGGPAGERRLAPLLEGAVPVAAPETVAAPGGRRITVQAVVVEASDIKTPLDRGYDPALRRGPVPPEPTLAERAMAGALDPDQLGLGPSLDRGAPLVGPDGSVEAGNARVSAIRLAYLEPQGGAAMRYRRALQALGVDTKQFQEPVLIRQRLSAVDDRAALARDLAAVPAPPTSLVDMPLPPQATLPGIEPPALRVRPEQGRLPGTEPTDRSPAGKAARRRNDAPPKGGLFDPAARAQADIADVIGDPGLAREADRVMLEAGGDLVIRWPDADGTLRDVPFSELMRTIEEDAAAARELADCLGGAVEVQQP